RQARPEVLARRTGSPKAEAGPALAGCPPKNKDARLLSARQIARGGLSERRLGAELHSLLEELPTFRSLAERDEVPTEIVVTDGVLRLQADRLPKIFFCSRIISRAVSTA